MHCKHVRSAEFFKFRGVYNSYDRVMNYRKNNKKQPGKTFSLEIPSLYTINSRDNKHYYYNTQQEIQ